MKIPHNIVVLASGIIIPTAFNFLQEAILVMVPWMIVMFFVVLADLAAGIWKSYKLGIELRFSRGLRETMGKLLVYFAFVCMIACINVAYAGEFQFAKWAAGVVITIEFGSIIGNFLKPHGINISLSAIVKAILQKSPLPITCEAANDMVKEQNLEDIIKEEKAKAELLGTGLDEPKKSRKNKKNVQS